MASQSIAVKAWENQLFVSVIGKVFQELVAFRVDRGIVWTTGNDDPGIFRINIAGLYPLALQNLRNQLGVKPLAVGLKGSLQIVLVWIVLLWQIQQDFFQGQDFFERQVKVLADFNVALEDPVSNFKPVSAMVDFMGVLDQKVSDLDVIVKAFAWGRRNDNLSFSFSGNNLQSIFYSRAASQGTATKLNNFHGLLSFVFVFNHNLSLIRMDFTIFLWKMQRKILKIHDNRLLNIVIPVLEEA